MAIAKKDENLEKEKARIFSENPNDFEYTTRTRTVLEKSLFGKNREETETVPLKKQKTEAYDFYEPAKNAVVKAIEDIEKQFRSTDVSPKDYVTTGIKNLNFHKGDLIVFGARPSIGKTAFSLSLLNYLAVERKRPVGYISSGDVDFGRIGQRLISMESGVPYHKIRAGLLNVEDVRNIQNSASMIYDSPFYYYNKPNIMFAELELTARMMVENAGIQLIVIDSFEYLQEIVDAKEDEYRFDLEELLDNLKEMAKDLNIPIILLMDLPISENGLQPSLCDFKKYMVIPHKADMVLFLHRERCKDAENTPDCKLIISKNENGACFEIPTSFNPITACFEFERNDN